MDENAWEIGEERHGGLEMTDHPGGYGDEIGLCCPVCGFEYVHLEAIEPRSFAVKDGVTGLTFSAECGHMWRTELREHKGGLFVNSTRLNDYM